MKFSDIPAHEEVKARLRNLVDSERLPHALLIHGREGIGKMAMARALASYIHCTNRRDGDSCGECPACRQHAAFNHIDTHYSFPVLKLKGKDTTVSDDWIDEWRQFLTESPYMDFTRWLALLDNPNGQPRHFVEESTSLSRKLTFTSHVGRQVVILWLPERMREECANKMLKLIEEPLGDTMFILVSNDSGSILPTIYSRCQRVEMLRVPDDVVARYAATRHSLQPDEASGVARLADGSFLEADRRVGNLGRQEEHLELFMQLMRLAYQRRVKELRSWSDTVAGLGREGIVEFLTYSISQFRENLICHLHEPRLSRMTQSEAAFASRFHPFINERNILQLNERFETAITDILANGNAKIILFELAVRVIMLLRQ